MTRYKTLFAAIVLLTASLFSAAPQNARAADGATAQALRLWDQIRPISESFDKTIESLEALRFKSRYCKPPHANDKSFDQSYLDSITSQTEGDYRELRNIQRRLQRLMGNDGRARAAIEAKAGSVSPVNANFWRPYNSQIARVRSLKSAKQAELNGAREINCNGTTPGSDQPSSTSAPEDSNPLTGTDIAPPDYAAVAKPEKPKKICTDDEKYQYVSRVGEERQKARTNSLRAANYVIKLGRVFRTAQAEGNGAVANAVRPLYDRAVTDSNARETTARELDALWDEATALSVEDCDEIANATVETTLNALPDIDYGVELPGVEIRPVDIPTLPQSVCEDDERVPFITAASTALSNALRNQSQWERRLQGVARVMARGEGDPGALQTARHAARMEAAKWRKISGDAQTAFDAAQSIPIIDCTTKGGLLEPGKLHTSIGGLDAFGALDPDVKPVNIPAVPEFVCSSEDYVAIRDALYLARDNAFHNLMEWNNRGAAIRAALANRKGDEATLRRAQREARVQSAHWRAVNDQAKQKIWNELPHLVVRKCDDSEDQVGYRDVENGNAAAALANARASKPTYDGGANAAGGYFGNLFGLSDRVGDSLSRRARADANDRLNDVEPARMHDRDETRHAPPAQSETPTPDATQNERPHDEGASDGHPLPMAQSGGTGNESRANAVDDIDFERASENETAKLENARGDEQSQPSASVMHVPTGLFVNGAFSEQAPGRAGAAPDGSNTEDNANDGYDLGQRWRARDNFSLRVDPRFYEKADDPAQDETDSAAQQDDHQVKYPYGCASGLLRIAPSYDLGRDAHGEDSEEKSPAPPVNIERSGENYSAPQQSQDADPDGQY